MKRKINTFFVEQDADISHLKNKKIAIIGYGNQGRAQAMNLRDNSLDIIIGNLRDDYFDQAIDDGFETVSISEAADKADIISLLIPDQVLPQIFNDNIAPFLYEKNVLNFSHGYNIHFNTISPPDFVDIILVAPRMIGSEVCKNYRSGSGVASLLAVYKDYSGNAWPITLAVAKAIGALKGGAIRSTFKEETELDLYTEQAFWPMIYKFLMLSFELLARRGYQKESILLELYASGEPSHVFHKIAEKGLFRQMNLHSQTSQFGTLTNLDKVIDDNFLVVLENIIINIENGTFAQDWQKEAQSGYKKFKILKDRMSDHPINKIEDLLKKFRQSPLANPRQHNM